MRALTPVASRERLADEPEVGERPGVGRDGLLPGSKAGDEESVLAGSKVAAGR